MVEFDALRVEHQSVRERTAVAHVAEDGGAEGSQVDPDLMFAPGDWLGFNEQIVGPALQDSDAGLRGDAFPIDPDRAVARHPDGRIDDHLVGPVDGRPSDESDVRLIDGPSREALSQ
jgi:hypothetical protein